LETAYTQVLALARKQKFPMRMAALSVGIKRVQEAKKNQRIVSVMRLARSGVTKHFSPCNEQANSY